MHTTYHHAGALVTERFPGNIIRRTAIDSAGRETGMSYNGQVTDSGSGSLVQDQPWISWTSLYTGLDQLNRQYAPYSGAAVRGRVGSAASALNRSFGYDKAGRLVFAKERYTNADLVGGNPECVSRTYAFDANGNRTGSNSVDPAADGSCTTTGGSPVGRVYDGADRPVSGGNGSGSYVYDELGRQTVIPAADAPKPAEGDLALGYYDNDAIKTISQGGQTTGFTLDGAGRRHTQTSTGGPVSNTLVRHYADDGDNPAWSVEATGGTTTTTRYAELVDGDLGLTLTSVGAGPATAQLDLATPRDDIATTVTLPTGATAPGAASAAGLDSWTDYTEYGTPRQAVDTTPGGITGIGYRWLGAKQRATLEAGLTLMGARVYNQATGLFTSMDPVHGGGATVFGYPTDPVQVQDLSGEIWGPVLRGLRKACKLYCKRAATAVWSKVGRPAFGFAGKQVYRFRKFIYRNKYIGGRSRLFGDDRNGVSSGRFNARDRRLQIGWSGRREENGKARTIFRISFKDPRGSTMRHFDIFRVPWRGDH